MKTITSVEDLPEVGIVNISELSLKTQESTQASQKLPKESFRDF